MSNTRIACELLAVAELTAFGGGSYAEPLNYRLKDSPELLKKYDRDYASVQRRALSKISAMLKRYQAAFKAEYPNANVRTDIRLDKRSSPYYPEIYTTGRVQGISFSGELRILAGRKEFVVKLSVEHSVDGDTFKGVEISPKQSSVHTYIGNWDMRSKEIRGNRAPSWDIVKGVIEDIANSNLEVRKALSPEKVEQNTMSIDIVEKFARGIRTWFDIEKDNDSITLDTREHGDVGSESPGDEDVREARRLVQLFKQEFGNKVRVDPDTADEWVSVTVSIPKETMRASRGISEK